MIGLGRNEGRDVRPGYYGLEGPGYVAVAYADPGYDAEETHEADDTGAMEVEYVSPGEQQG